MKEFRNGVRWYTEASCPVHFPEDDICCYRCVLMGNDYGSKREVCRRTGEILVAPMITIGDECPLRFVVKEDENGTDV